MTREERAANLATAELRARRLRGKAVDLRYVLRKDAGEPVQAHVTAAREAQSAAEAAERDYAALRALHEKRCAEEDAAKRFAQAKAELSRLDKLRREGRPASSDFCERHGCPVQASRRALALGAGGGVTVAREPRPWPWRSDLSDADDRRGYPKRERRCLAIAPLRALAAFCANEWFQPLALLTCHHLPQDALEDVRRAEVVRRRDPSSYPRPAGISRRHRLEGAVADPDVWLWAAPFMWGRPRV